MLLAKFRTKCKRCGKEVLIDDLVHDKNTKTGICRACSKIVPKTTELKKDTKVTTGKTKMKCINCNYTFSRDLTKHRKECPYCKSTKLTRA